MMNGGLILVSLDVDASTPDLIAFMSLGDLQVHLIYRS